MDVRRGAGDAPPGSEFFHFRAVFGKEYRLAHPLWELAPLREILDPPLNKYINFYHPRMRVGNVFGHVCLSACVSVCVSVCLGVCLSVFLSVQAITFEPLNIETSFLICRYILTITRSSLSIKIIGSRSRS